MNKIRRKEKLMINYIEEVLIYTLIDKYLLEYKSSTEAKKDLLFQFSYKNIIKFIDIFDEVTIDFKILEDMVRNKK